jgi:hypothetical protein
MNNIFEWQEEQQKELSDLMASIMSLQGQTKDLALLAEPINIERLDSGSHGGFLISNINCFLERYQYMTGQTLMQYRDDMAERAKLRLKSTSQ